MTKEAQGVYLPAKGIFYKTDYSLHVGDVDVYITYDGEREMWKVTAERRVKNDQILS